MLDPQIRRAQAPTLSLAMKRFGARLLTCPSCRQRGPIEGPSSTFEPRGRWPETDEALVRCGICLSGVVVTPAQFPRGLRGRLIDAETWLEMGMVGTNHAPEQSADEQATSLHLPEAIRELATRGASDEELSHLVSEALSITEAAARELVGELRTAAAETPPHEA